MAEKKENYGPLMDLINRKSLIFPSTLLRQRKGPSYSTPWDWNRLAARITNSSTPSLLFGPTDLRQLVGQVVMVETIIEQIRHCFYNGNLPKLDKDQVAKVMEEFQISSRKRGGIGRNFINGCAFEYLPETFKLELEREHIYSKWTSNILSTGPEVRQRNALVKWVMETAIRFNYVAETTHLAVFFIDAYLAIPENKIAASDWRLLGVGALFVAAKLEEVAPVSVARLIRNSGESYKAKDVYGMEILFVEKLKLDFRPPLSSLFTQMVLLGGSLEFPNVTIKKLVMDLSAGILFNGLLYSRLFKAPASEKARVALEIATEFVFYQYKLFNRRDTSSFEMVTTHPGKELGSFAIELCTEMFIETFVNPRFPPSLPRLQIRREESPSSGLRVA